MKMAINSICFLFCFFKIIFSCKERPWLLSHFSFLKKTQNVSHQCNTPGRLCAQCSDTIRLFYYCLCIPLFTRTSSNEEGIQEIVTYGGERSPFQMESFVKSKELKWLFICTFIFLRAIKIDAEQCFSFVATPLLT